MKKINSLILLILFCLPLYADTLQLNPLPFTQFAPDQIKSLQIPPFPKDSYTFVNDSIVFPQTQSIGKMVYVEHKNNIDNILEYVYPIIMLLLGVAIDRGILYASEKSRINRIGTLWMIELENLKVSLLKQIKSFRELISSYCENEKADTIPPTPKYEVLKCEIFNSFSKKDLYDYLKDNDTAKAKESFHKILNIISTTKDTFEQTLKSFEASMNSASQCYNNINLCLREFTQEIIIKEEKYQHCLGTDYERLIQLKQSQIDKCMPHINIFEFQTSFIFPAMNLINQHDKKECAELLKWLMQLLDYIMALKNEKEYCKNNFNQAISLFEGVIKNISALPPINEENYNKRLLKKICKYFQLNFK